MNKNDPPVYLFLNHHHSSPITHQLTLKSFPTSLCYSLAAGSTSAGGPRLAAPSSARPADGSCGDKRMDSPHSCHKHLEGNLKGKHVSQIKT